jgi:hypothetical protein
MDDSISDFINNTLSQGMGWYLLLLFCGSTLLLLNWKRYSRASRGIGLIMLTALICELLGVGLIRLIITNYPAYHLLHFAHFLIYGITYASFSNTALQRKVFLWAGMLLSVNSLVLTFWVEGIMSFPTLASSILSLFVVVSALVSFLIMIKNPISTPLALQPLFWFNLANLTYYSCTYFFYGLYDYYISHGLTMPGWIDIAQKTMIFFLYTSYISALILDGRRHAR